MLRRLSFLATVSALFSFASAAQAAPIWTPIASGTSGTITSIVYQSPTRFWYATSGGTIAYWNGSGFTAGSSITPGEDFVDLAFQPTSVPGGPGDTLDGYGVTSNGHVWRSTNGGVSWAQITPPNTRTDCSVASTPIAESELNAVQWANSTTVFLMGDNSTILRSTNANAGSPTFTEINKNSVTCAMQGQTFTEDMTDATFLPANPDDALFVAQDFGRIYQSSNALGGSPSGTQVNGGTVNEFQGNPRIAQDAASPNRIWVVDHAPASSGCGGLCLVVSTDGGPTFASARFANDSSVVGGLYDISSQGGVEVTAGSAGEIFTSVDGTNFYNQPAGGGLAAENWRAEAAYDAQHAAVGGGNGALVVTSAANTIPAVAPTAPGPAPTTTAPPSGSRPITIRTGGATIKVFRIVTVTGRNARFVPVIVSSTKPRKFTAQILRLKGKKKALARGRLTLRRKHGGHGTIRVKLPAKVKPGRYYIVIRETTLKGKKVGKLVKVKFRLK